MRAHEGGLEALVARLSRGIEGGEGVIENIGKLVISRRNGRPIDATGASAYIHPRDSEVGIDLFRENGRPSEEVVSELRKKKLTHEVLARLMRDNSVITPDSATM